MLTPWKKSYDQTRQHIKKQRHYFANKSPSSQSYGFPSSCVWMWELDYQESWVVKNWYFWTWCWRFLRVPWTARRSNKSILKKINPEYSLERLMLKLKLQYVGHLKWRADSFEKDLDADKDWGKEKGMTDGWMLSPTRWTWLWANSGIYWRIGKPGVLQSMWLQRVGHD